MRDTRWDKRSWRDLTSDTRHDAFVLQVIPLDGGDARSLRISRRAFYGTLAAAGFGFTALTGFAVHQYATSGSLRAELHTALQAKEQAEAEARELRSKNVALEDELVRWKQRIAVLDGRLAETEHRLSALEGLAATLETQVTGKSTIARGQAAPLSAPTSGSRPASLVGEEPSRGAGGNVGELLFSLAERLNGSEERGAAIQHKIALLGEIAEHVPSIMPADGRIVSGFGMRRDPFTFALQMHTGVDIANVSGTPIRAAASGVVVDTGWVGGYGLTVRIAHGNGVETFYAHLSQVVVQRGQSVKKGELIGYMGSTGRSSGPHLHYEVRLGGRPIDPVPYLGGVVHAVAEEGPLD
ncbi:MAG: peptidoglycan DD-metalloendopeptidase family protein [Brockia lithotrophica]|nr:peptidoglycan DD-metalloendopeptidase family protein [Brockia lithotrophica]